MTLQNKESGKTDFSLYLLPDPSLLHSARPTLQTLRVQMPQVFCRGHAFTYTQLRIPLRLLEGVLLLYLKHCVIFER